jgi:type I restriction enzyme S subunit
MSWPIVGLLEVASITAKLVDPRDSLYADVPLVAPDHVESETGRILAFQSAQAQEAISGKYLVEATDVIYSKIRPYLMKVAIPGRPVLCSADMYPLHCGEKILPDYLKQVLLGNPFTQFAIACSNRTGIPKVNREELAQFRFRLPDLETQRNISSKANIWDDAIATANALHLELERRKQGLMQQLLTGRRRLKGFKGKWKPISLGTILERVTRKNTTGCLVPLTVSAQRGLVEQSSYFAKQIAAADNDHYLLLKRGEFAYNRSASAGYPLGAIKRLDSFDEGIVSTLCLCFRIADDEKTDSDFLVGLIEAGVLNRALRAIAHEGARSHGLLNVTAADFFNIRVNLPNIDEQCAMAEVLRDMDAELALRKSQLDELKTQKRALMQKLLSGEWRLPESPAQSKPLRKKGLQPSNSMRKQLSKK